MVVATREAAGLPAARLIRPGNVVWGKVAGSPWWPAVVVDVADVQSSYAALVKSAAAADATGARGGVHLLIFLHDHSFSAVYDDDIVEWADRCDERARGVTGGKGKKQSASQRKKLDSAVAEAKRELAKPRMLRFLTPAFRAAFVGQRDPLEVECAVPGCWVCFADGSEEALLACDHEGCRREYHAHCLAPSQRETTSGEQWNCPRCDDWVRDGGRSSSSAAVDGLLRPKRKRLRAVPRASRDATGLLVAVGSGRPLDLQHARVMIGEQFQAEVPRWSGR